MATGGNTEHTFQSFRECVTIVSRIQQRLNQLDVRLKSMATQWSVELLDTQGNGQHGSVNRVDLRSSANQVLDINGQRATIRLSMLAMTGQSSNRAPGFQIQGRQIILVNSQTSGLQPVWLTGQAATQPLLSITGKQSRFVYDGQLLVSGERQLRQAISELVAINQRLEQYGNAVRTRLESRLEPDYRQWPILRQLAQCHCRQLSNRVFHCQERVVALIDFIEGVASVPDTSPPTSLPSDQLGSLWASRQPQPTGSASAVRLTDPGQSKLTRLLSNRQQKGTDSRSSWRRQRPAIESRLGKIGPDNHLWTGMPLMETIHEQPAIEWGPPGRIASDNHLWTGMPLMETVDENDENDS